MVLRRNLPLDEPDSFSILAFSQPNVVRGPVPRLCLGQCRETRVCRDLIVATRQQRPVIQSSFKVRVNN